jgi:hypothetical protein
MPLPLLLSRRTGNLTKLGGELLVLPGDEDEGEEEKEEEGGGEGGKGASHAAEAEPRARPPM